MQVVDIFLNRNPTLSHANSQESLHESLENTETLEHKMLDSDSVNGRGHFGGGIARARVYSQDSRGLGNGIGCAANAAYGFGHTGPNFSVLPQILQSITLY